MRKEEPVAVIAAAKHELELLHPARPGDRISKTVACLEKRPSKSKPDRGIAIFSTDMKTQNDVVFAQIKTTLLLRRKPKG